MTPTDPSTKPYVALEGIQHGNRFITPNTPGQDPTKSAKGETWYRALGYADTIEEAQRIIWPTKADEYKAVWDHLKNTRLLSS